jgi:CRP-like cAMP-binding protein
MFINDRDWMIVRSTPLFSALSDRTILTLIGGQTPRKYEKGHILFQQGEAANSFFVILDGWVKVFRGTADGVEAVVGVFRRGETFAEAAIFLGRQYPVSAEVVSPSLLLAIDGEAFRMRIRQEPDLALHMLASASQHLKFLVEHIEQIKVLDGPQRVADFLLRLCPVSSGACSIELPYEKSLIAGRLGMKPESLSRSMARLRPLGVVVERDVVQVSDVKALIQFVDFSASDEDQAL